MHSKIKINSLYRQYLTVRVLLSYLFGRLNEKMENISHWIFHVTIMHKKIGYTEFSVADEEADGSIIYRSINEEGRVCLEQTNFRIDNRWLVRRGARPTTNLTWQVKSEAEIHGGFKIHSVIWGSRPHQRSKPMSPYDLSLLPSEEEIQKFHARLKKFQDLMARWFPANHKPLNAIARLPTNEEMEARDAEHREAMSWNFRDIAIHGGRGLSDRDTARMILKRM